MEQRLKIIKKPDWISWDEIHQVLKSAHKENHDSGVVMKHQNMTGGEIEELLKGNGTMFVALSGQTLVGTIAVKIMEMSFWFGKATIAYCCFASVLPEYQGKGVYRSLAEYRESYVREKGLDIMVFNTHPKNNRILAISQRNGYRKAKYFVSRNATYVYMLKWLNGCPYSYIRCQYEYWRWKTLVLVKFGIKTLLG